MGRYDEIIGMEHHTSLQHRRMSRLDRAAQFAPFAALTGFDGVLAETGRQTSQRLEIDETRARRLDGVFRRIAENISDRPAVKVTWYVKDRRKEGGEYVTREGRVRTVDFTQMRLVFTDGTTIPVSDIYDISETDGYNEHQ